MIMATAVFYGIISTSMPVISYVSSIFDAAASHKNPHLRARYNIFKYSKCNTKNAPCSKFISHHIYNFALALQ